MTRPVDIVIAVFLEVLVIAGAGVALWAYAWRNPWYASRVGRAITVLLAAIVLIIVVSLLRYFLHWGVWAGFISYGFTLLAVWGLAVAFVRERRRIRREERRAVAADEVHRIERETP